MPDVEEAALDPVRKRLLHQAQQALADGRAADVRAVIADLLEQTPACPSLWRLLSGTGAASGEAAPRRLSLRSLEAAVLLRVARFAPAQALPRLCRLLARDPHLAAGWQALAVIADRQDWPGTAVWAWEQVVRLQPQRSGARGGLARAYLRQGRPEPAVRLTEAWLAAEPGNAIAASLLREASVALAMARDGWERSSP